MALPETLRRELRADRLLGGLLAGVVVGVVVVIVAISFAALLFSGDLEPLTARGIGFALFGAAVLGAAVALTSSLPGMVATPQDSSTAILALIAAAVAAGLPASASADEIFLTVLGAIALTTVLTGSFFLLLGWFRLGELIRFIPYPVIGGFLAGTGWLLVQGSFGVMAGTPLGFSGLPTLAAREAVLLWLPGTIFALALLLTLRRFRHFSILPAMLLGFVAVFYLGLPAFGLTVEEAGVRGLLLGPFPESGLWSPADWAAVASGLSEIRWGLILSQIASVAAILIVGVVALLLNATGLELAFERDVDLDRELRSAGLGNVLAGLAGGMPGFQALSLTSLGHRICPGSRVAALTSAAMCFLTLALGGSVLSLFPRPALGGLLLFLGLAFLVEWVWDARAKMPRLDYFVVLLILLVIGVVGYLESIGAGILLALILFVVNYSRIDVVKHALSGEHHTSNVDRPAGHRHFLAEHGGQLFILKLQGFIFFGTANSLLKRVRRRVENEAAGALRFVVLDFRLVSGLDSSAVLSFAKMEQLARARGFELIFAELSAPLQELLLKKEGTGGGGPEDFSELDRAVEWCEDRLLAVEGLSPDDPERPLRERLTAVFPTVTSIDVLMSYLERRDLPRGHYLMRQGQDAENVYFIESGQVTAQIELDDGKAHRLLTMGAGSVVGELELYLDRPRSASVVAETPTVIYRLSATRLRDMEERDPELAAAFHRFISKLLAERLANTNSTLQALLR